MRIEFFKGRRWLATASLATAIAVTGFYGLRAAALGTCPSKIQRQPSNGPALRGGFRTRILGRREARPSGCGEHFILERS